MRLRTAYIRTPKEFGTMFAQFLGWHRADIDSTIFSLSRKGCDMANSYHNTKLDKAVEGFDLTNLSAEDITRDSGKDPDGNRIHTLSVLDTEYVYGDKHQRNSDYYKLLNQINRALAKKEKEAQPA